MPGGAQTELVALHPILSRSEEGNKRLCPQWLFEQGVQTNVSGDKSVHSHQSSLNVVNWVRPVPLMTRE